MFMENRIFWNQHGNIKQWCENWLSYYIILHERNQQLDMNASKYNWIRIPSAESVIQKGLTEHFNGIISDLSKLFL